MTTLKERLRTEVTRLRKAGNKMEVTQLNLVLGEVDLNEKRGKVATEFTDEQVLEVLTRQVKRIREAAVQFADGGATERAAKENAEADFLSTYLPTMMSQEEVVAFVTDFFQGKDVDHVGKATGMVMKELKGKADGATVKAAVAEVIAG